MRKLRRRRDGPCCGVVSARRLDMTRPSLSLTRCASLQVVVVVTVAIVTAMAALPCFAFVSSPVISTLHPLHDHHIASRKMWSTNNKKEESPILSEGKSSDRRLAFVHFSKPPSLLEDQETSREDKPQISGQSMDDKTETIFNQEEGLREEDAKEDLNSDSQKEPSQTYLLISEREVSRRKMLQQVATLFVGTSAAVVGLASRQDEQRQEEKAFVRLEPYPSRRQAFVDSPKALSYTNLTSSSNGTSSATTVSKNITKLNTNTSTTIANSKNRISTTNTTKNAINATATKKEVAPVNFTKVAAENSINITLKDCDRGGCVSINGTSFQKIIVPAERPTSPIFDRIVPKWITNLMPQPKAPVVIKDIPDSEILLAATVAGSVIEMGRTLLLYPLATVKTRIQARQQSQYQRQRIRHVRRTIVRSTNNTSGTQRMERFSGGDSSLRLPSPSSQQHGATTSNSNNKNSNRRRMERFSGGASSLRLSSSSQYGARSSNSNKNSNSTTVVTDTTSNGKTSTRVLSATASVEATRQRRSSGQRQRTTAKNKLRFLGRRLRVLQLNIRRHVAEGNLYAGLVPSLLVSVPATGVYYGVRDVTKRALAVAGLDDVAITLLGALNADVVSLALRTPVDALAARLQAVAASSPSSSSSSSSSSQRTMNANNTITLAELMNTTGDADPFTTGRGVVNISATSEDALSLATSPEALTSTENTAESLTTNDDGMGSSFSMVSPTVPRETSSSFVEAKAITTMADAEEALFQEEQEHYKQKATTLVVNDTSSSVDRLLATILPEEYDHEDQYLFMRLQRQEVNIDDLFDGIRPAPSLLSSTRTISISTDLSNLTSKQLKRQQRNEKKGLRKRANRIHALEGNSGAGINDREAPQVHYYMQEFLDALKEEVAQIDAVTPDLQAIEESLNKPTIFADWDEPIKKLRDQVSSFLEEKSGANASLAEGDDTHDWDGTNDKRLDWKSTEWGRHDVEELALALNSTTDKQEAERDSAPARMEEQEEKELLQELQEEKVYNEDWLRQSWERLPGIIITDLPYLLSRIALNRIVIHGKVNIGEYAVDTVAIAMLCALLTTPFDVVRTRLLVENEDAAFTEDIMKEIGAANGTTVISDGQVILLDGNTTLGQFNLPSPPKDYINQGVLKTMISISKEGDGGIRNLYAGWLERVVYLGMARALLDPINIITYVGIRDTLLLRWFD